ncbi:hypothetical protein [Streptomyces sp. NRRL F-5126]|uniref:hypothetical protein n=1 Tax=Streptomyces sp. NRRL F-5126 TaxID=1463857 RepID=UPI0004C99A56|nr:hypothetical protein [Streptomyces sp. NRRL F-5126]
MSRETESSPSGPHGRGGSPYPTEAPPYGSRQAPGQQDATDEAGSAAGPRQDEPRTETTLTTRIRINIPGSRPIPPVVVRTPVTDGEATDGRGIAALAQSDAGGERTGSTPAPGDPAASAAQDPAEEPAPQPEKKPTSDWFAPRKPMSTGHTMGAGAAVTAAGSVPGAGEAGAGQDTSPFGDLGSPDPYQDGASHTGGPGTPPFGVPGTAGPGPDDRPNGPTAGPATGGSTLGAMPAGPGHTPPFGSPEIPDFTGQHPAADHPTATHTSPEGPASGGSTLGAMPAGPGHTPPFGSPEIPDFTGQHPGADHATATHTNPEGPAPSATARQGDAPPRLSDDTAILTPQQLAPEPGAPAAGHVSGSTLSSGAPIRPSDQRTAPFPGSGTQGGQGPRPRPDLTPRLDDRPAPGQGPGPGGPGPGGPTAAGRPEAASAPAAPAKPAAKKKGRSKPVLGVVALLVVAGGLYGAGLVMSHTDVPKGTTVLGVDIGGSTKDQAVDTLEKQLGKRATLPLKLTVDGRSSTLSPENAGLTLDDQATVQAAAGPDYNPVDVVGSLFGRQRPIDPVMPVDDEKLTAALSGIAGSLGSEREGTITFDTGKPVAVAGKAGKGLDVARAKQSVRDAYRNQVETGSPVSVTLPTVEQQPTISQADIQQAMKDFAKPAMSDLVTIKASNGASIQFGGISLPKILSMKAVDGKLVDSYDLKALKNAYGSAFDGVKVKRADGSSTAVTPQDVADQLRVALRGKTPAERTREIGSPTKGLTG